MQESDIITYFLVVLVATILLVCFGFWWRGRNSTKADDLSIWLLVGLLLIAIFGLGAFVMYAMLHFF